MPANKPEDYEVLGTIGTGSYGTCKKIRRKADGKVRVWKELDYGSMSNSEKQLLVSEVNLLRELKHENIVRYHDRIIDKVLTKIYIIMEFCPGGDLSELVSRHKKQRKYIDEPFIWKVLYQVSSALKELHKCSKDGNTVLHRDLKPANVFLDPNNNCKLGDFGLARVLHHETSFAKTYVGTPYYMSPELANGSAYNEKSDIWSLGCLIYELCALLPPFLAANQKMLAMKIKDGYFKPIPSHYSRDLQKIIEMMLTVDECRRPSIEEILSSSYILKNTGSQNEAKSSSSSGDFSPSLLHRKEEQLRIRENRLNEKEMELNLREKLLNEREKMLEEKLSRVELARYPGHKRHAPDVISEKENAPNFHNELYSGKYDRGLRLLNVNHEQHNRFGERPRNGYGGIR